MRLVFKLAKPVAKIHNCRFLYSAHTHLIIIHLGNVGSWIRASRQTSCISIKCTESTSLVSHCPRSAAIHSADECSTRLHFTALCKMQIELKSWWYFLHVNHYHIPVKIIWYSKRQNINTWKCITPKTGCTYTTAGATISFANTIYCIASGSFALFYSFLFFGLRLFSLKATT